MDNNDNQTRGKGGTVRLWETLPRLARLSLLISCWLDWRGTAIDNHGGRSILEALFCKLKSLEDIPKGQLAGKMATVIDLMTRLPVDIWFLENPRASDVKLEENILQLVPNKTLLLLDRGFYHFSFWLKLIERNIHLITRLKKGAAIQVKQVFTKSYDLKDSLVRLGSGTAKTPFITLLLDSLYQ